MACRDVWNTWPSGLRSPQNPPASPSGFVVTGGPRAMYFTHHGKPWLKPIPSYGVVLFKILWSVGMHCCVMRGLSAIDERNLISSVELNPISDVQRNCQRYTYQKMPRIRSTRASLFHSWTALNVAGLGITKYFLIIFYLLNSSPPSAAYMRQ